MSGIPKVEDTLYFDFTTHNPSTGAVSDADSTPTCEVFEDNTDTAILSPTVVKRTSKTGNYRVPVAATAANGFEVGKNYNVVVSATVNAVSAKAVVAQFVLDGKRVNDLNDVSATGVADAVLTRKPSDVEATATADSVAFALALISGRHKVTVADNANGTATVTLYKSNGTTSWGIITAETAPSADPFTGLRDAT